MRILAIASQKDRLGKATLSGHLAVAAQRVEAGSVVRFDIHLQGPPADCGTSGLTPSRPVSLLGGLPASHFGPGVAR